MQMAHPHLRTECCAFLIRRHFCSNIFIALHYFADLFVSIGVFTGGTCIAKHLHLETIFTCGVKEQNLISFTCTRFACAHTINSQYFFSAHLHREYYSPPLTTNKQNKERVNFNSPGHHLNTFILPFLLPQLQRLLFHPFLLLLCPLFPLLLLFLIGIQQRPSSLLAKRLL